MSLYITLLIENTYFKKNFENKLYCYLHFFIYYFFKNFSADVREFFQLDNPRNSSINIDEEEDEVSELVRMKLFTYY